MVCIYEYNDLRVQKEATAYGLAADEGASDLNRWVLVILNLICWIGIWSPDGFWRVFARFWSTMIPRYFDCGYFQ